MTDGPWPSNIYRGPPRYNTNIFVSGPNINELCLSMITELSKLSQWFKFNKLSLNIKKTNFIVFKPRTKSLTDVPNE